jgi:hypothetical protein
VLIVATFLAMPAVAKTPSAARSLGVAWLENHQNADGSWGSGPTTPLATAEALGALAAAGRAHSTVALGAKAWLLNREFQSLDYWARSIRALSACGIDMRVDAQALALLGEGRRGWGLTSGGAENSYDSALAVAAIEAAGEVMPDAGNKLDEILYFRIRPDFGFGQDGVPLSNPEASDRTLTAEIVRALSQDCFQWLLDAPWALCRSVTYDSNRLDFHSAVQFISSDGLGDDYGPPGSRVNEHTSNLELAARLAAIHSVGITDAALQSELLRNARFATGIWSSDPYVNALALLAVATIPGESFAPACVGDADCDGTPDSSDAFPFDPLEQSDLDRDGQGDNADPDRDGDGVPDLSDAFPSDPMESADRDADGIGDVRDIDDDNDSVSDLAELEAGTDPLLWDTEGDGIGDGSDPCPLSVGIADADGDGVCDAQDGCDGWADAYDVENLDGDLLCDGADDDDDGDGVADDIEIALGFDPRDPLSLPDPNQLASADPTGDIDGDGLSNSTEVNAGPGLATNPFRVDTDDDLFVDGADGVVPVSRLAGGWDLNGDGFVDGESDFRTSPVDATDHPGKPGDVAPLGHPDARLDVADSVVEARLVGDPGLLAGLPDQNAAIAALAADADADGAITLSDLLKVLKTPSD